MFEENVSLLTLKPWRLIGHHGVSMGVLAHISTTRLQFLTYNLPLKEREKIKGREKI